MSLAELLQREATLAKARHLVDTVSPRRRIEQAIREILLSGEPGTIKLHLDSPRPPSDRLKPNGATSETGWVTSKALVDVAAVMAPIPPMFRSPVAICNFSYAK